MAPNGYTIYTDTATYVTNTGTSTNMCYIYENTTTTVTAYKITNIDGYYVSISPYVFTDEPTEEERAETERRIEREKREALMKRLGVAGYRTIDIGENIEASKNRDPIAVKLLRESLRAICRERRLEID